MLNADQIAAFIAAVNENGYCAEEEDVITTQDAVADFTREMGGPDDRATSDVTLLIWYKRQSRKGQQRRDVIVADFGVARAVYMI